MLTRQFVTAATFALLIGLSALPPAAAEFGPESVDGYPINVDGQVLRPPVTGFATRDYPVDIAIAYGLLSADQVTVSAQGEPLNKAGPLTFYPYYPLLTAELQRLAGDHPDLVKLTSAGKSTAGLDIWMLEIADFANLDSGQGVPLDEREVVYLDGGTHSNEYSGVYFVTEVAQFLVEEYDSNDTARWAVENRHTYIVPMVNPDGSHAFGRLNAKAVNINRNFAATWGTTEESFPMNNPGPAPNSEVETRIISDLFATLRPDYVGSIHCCGNLWLHPWGAEQLEDNADLQQFSRVCDEAYSSVRDACGEIWSTIYPAGGSTVDEAYVLAGSAAWGFEMSGRANKVGIWGEPTTEQDVREQERESWAGIMHAFEHVHQYGAHPKVMDVREGNAGELRIRIENVGYGNLSYANLTVGDATFAIAPLMPGESATFDVAGSYQAGTVLPLALDWQKRVMAGPQGVRILHVPLVEEGGRLVGQLAGDAISPAGLDGAAPAANVPAPAVALVIVGVVVVALARRRRA